MKRVIVDNKFNAHIDLTGNDPRAIEVDEDVLEQIEKTKCFDVVNNCVIDYDGTKDQRIEVIKERITELKQKLKDTDYMAIKFAEGFITEYDYIPTRRLRQSYRDEINSLETELLTSEV